MKTFITIFISCSLALAASAMAQQDQSSPAPKKKQHGQGQTAQEGAPAKPQAAPPGHSAHHQEAGMGQQGNATHHQEMGQQGNAPTILPKLTIRRLKHQ